MLNTLRKMGFSKHTFSETIVVTEVLDNKWNCAPMGVKLENEELYFYVYEGTRTLEALRKNKYLTINIVYDVNVFTKCIFKTLDNEKLYELASNFPVPHIATADAYIECKLIGLQEANGKFKAICEPLNVVVKRNIPRTFNRAFPAIIEALIYYTKIKPFKKMGLDKELNDLMKKIMHCKYIVKHATTNKKYLKIVDNIISKVLDEIGEQQ